MSRVYRFRGRHEVEALATDFRERFFPGVVGPLDPEEVIEHDLGIDIVPREGLARRANVFGWLSCDGRHIFVDATLQKEMPREYVALLTHELGHVRLHGNLLPKSPPRDRDTFMSFHAELGEVLVTQLELEAQRFGLALLMPSAELDPIFSDAAELAKDRFPSMNSAARLYVTTRVADHFGVTPNRAAARLEQVRMWRRLRESNGTLTLLPPVRAAARWPNVARGDRG